MRKIILTAFAVFVAISVGAQSGAIIKSSSAFNDFTFEVGDSTIVVNNGEVITIVGGTGISAASNVSTITFSLDADIEELNNVLLTSPTSGQVLEYDGTNWVNATDDTGAGGAMTQWNLDADSGTFQVVEDNETATISGGTGILTTVGATNTVTVSLSASIGDLNDVTITTPSIDQVVKYNGSVWVNGSDLDEQDLTFTDATRVLAISGGNSVDLSEGIQDEVGALLTPGTGISLNYDDGAGTLTITNTVVNTDAQTLSFTSPDLDISGGNSVDLSALLDNTDAQTLSITEATRVLAITGGNNVDLSESIQEEVNALVAAGTGISIVYDDGANTLTINNTETNTDNQTLSITESSRVLDISGGNNVDLSESIQEEINATLVGGTGIDLTYDDGGNTLTIDNTAGAQTLSFTSPNLSISGGNSVDISAIDTDEQTLSINNNTAVLTISTGNNVDLSEAIDEEVNSTLVAGTGLSKTYNDGAGTIDLDLDASLDDLTDVNYITPPQNTWLLKYDAVNGWWFPASDNSITNLFVDSDDNNAFQVTDNEIIDIEGGLGILTSHTGADFTISLNAALTNLGDVIITSPVADQVLTYTGTTWVNQAAAGGGSFSDFILTGDSGSAQTVNDGETVDIAGGTNISTVVGATNTVTVNWSADLGDLGNVNLGTLNNNDIIYYNSTAGEFQDFALNMLLSGDDADLSVLSPSVGFSFKFEGGNGITTDINTALTPDRVNIALDADIGDLNNVASTIPSNGNVLTYNSTLSRWEPQVGGGGGGGMDDWTLTGDSGTSQIVGDAEVVDIAGGTGVSTTVGNTNLLTVNLDFNSLTNDGGIDANNDFLVYYDVSTGTHKKDHVDDVLALGGGGGGMTSWVLTADGGTNQTITNAETVDIEGGNQITTIVGSNNKVTVNWSANLNDIADVILTSPTSGQVLEYNGSNWVNATDDTGGGGMTFTMVADAGVSQTISDGDAMLLLGGEGIGTLVGNTDQYTIDLDINGLTEDGLVNTATDYLVYYDVSTGSHKKEQISTLTGGGGSYSWTFTADSGFTQTVNDGENVEFLSDEGVFTITNSGDAVIIGLDWTEPANITSTLANDEFVVRRATGAYNALNIGDIDCITKEIPLQGWDASVSLGTNQTSNNFFVVPASMDNMCIDGVSFLIDSGTTTSAAIKVNASNQTTTNVTTSGATVNYNIAVNEGDKIKVITGGLAGGNGLTATIIFKCDCSGTP